MPKISAISGERISTSIPKMGCIAVAFPGRGGSTRGSLFRCTTLLFRHRLLPGAFRLALSYSLPGLASRLGRAAGHRPATLGRSQHFAAHEGGRVARREGFLDLFVDLSVLFRLGGHVSRS